MTASNSGQDMGSGIHTDEAISNWIKRLGVGLRGG